MKKALTKEQALGRLMGLCSRSEQCENDLIRKMIGWGIGVSDRGEIIDYLKENRYLDDSRYARSFVNDKARFAAWGPYKIRMELVKRKIKSEYIKSVLETVENQVWKEGLLRCGASKARTLQLTDCEEAHDNRQKLFRYIVSRGFSAVSASKAVKYFSEKEKDNP